MKTAVESDVCAVVVTHSPNLDLLSATISSVSGQVGRIIVCDNNSNIHLRDWPMLPQIDLILLKENFGIGFAQNIGARNAFEHGYRFILLLDQDSVPADGMVGHLLGVFDKASSQGIKLAAVSPESFDAQTFRRRGFARLEGYRFRKVDGNPGEIVEIDIAIASGLLIDRSAFEAIGPMNELMFIDAVDTEWCYRAATKEYKILGLFGPLLQHNIGDDTAHFQLGRTFHVPSHSPLRRYYEVRNSLFLSFRLTSEMRWKSAVLLGSLATTVLAVATSPSPFRQTVMAIKGGLAGIRGKLGAFGEPRVTSLLEHSSNRLQGDIYREFLDKESPRPNA